MNQKEYQMIFQIGANLASSFNTSFGSACKKLNELAKETAETSKVLKDISGFQKAKQALEKNEEKLEKQREEYKKLQSQLNEMETPSEEFIEQLRKQKEKLEAAEASVENQRNIMLDYSASLEEAGVNVQNLTEEQEKLQEQYEELKTAREHLQKISAEYDELTNKAREQATEVGKLIGVYAAAGAAFYKGAIEPAIEFESAYAGVLKTVDGTPEQLQRIKEDILDLSTNVPTAAADIAAVAEAAGQLGIAVEDITNFSSVMIDLGESTNLSADQAASDLAKFANITKMNTDNYSNLGSVIVDLGNNFATTESDIVSMATRLASTGEITGLSEAQIMAVATALSSVGIEAEAGGSAVSKLLKQFEVMYWNDDESAALDERVLNDYAKVAGVTIDEFKEIYGKDSLEAVSMFISGLNDVERNGKNAVQILSDLDITEIRMSNAVLSLAASDGILTKAVDVANTAWEENTALVVEAGKRYGTTESQIQMAKNSINNAGIALGEVFTPYVAEAAQGINDFAQNAAAWVRDNPNTVKQATVLITTLGGVILTFKTLRLAGTGIQTAVKGVQKLYAEGKLLSNIKWNAYAIAIAAFSTALTIANEKYKAYLQSTSDAIMYNNGASTSLSDLADRITSYGTEAYKAAQNTNQQAEELKGIRDNLADAKTQAEYYGQALRDSATLTPGEAESLKQPFEDLSDYLEQDFSTSFTLVFENFQAAAVAVMEDLGGDISEIDGLLQSFKNKYSENVSTAQQNIEDYLSAVIAGGEITEEDKSNFQKSQSMLYELAALDSQSKQDFDTAAAEIAGLDFGSDQEAAVAKINEITEYARNYFEEINNAQKAAQQENERLLAGYEIQHNYGMVSDEDFELYKGALATASVASNAAYQETFNGFMEEYKGVLELIQGQLDENITEVFNKSINSGNILADFTESAKAVWSVVTSGYTTTWDEQYINQHKEAAYKTVSGVIEAVDEMAKAAEIAPIVIPIETAYTATASGLINNIGGISFDGVRSSGIGHLSLRPEEVNVISAAYASGTNYSADTFLAGENGAEIVTNARGYKVYTAEETKDIFDTYTQIVAILPRLQRVNTAASINTPVLSSGTDGAGTPINVTITIEQNISGGSSEDISKSNDELVYKIREIMEEIRRDSSRRAFN